MDDQDLNEQERLDKIRNGIFSDAARESFNEGLDQQMDYYNDWQYNKKQYEYDQRNNAQLNVGEMDPLYAEHDRLGSSWTLGSQYNEGNLEDKQGKLEKLNNAVDRTFWNTLYDTVGGVGSMLDFEDYFNTDDEVGNWLTNWANDQKKETDKVNPIYQRKNAGMGSFAWWMNNGSALTSSMASFMIQGAMLGGGLRGLKWMTSKGFGAGKGLLKSKSAVAAKRGEDIATGAKQVEGANALSKLSTADAITGAQKAGDWLQKGAMSLALNQSAAISSATEVYNNAYNTAIERGLSHNEAKRIAASSASNTVNLSRANMLFNLTMTDKLLKGTGAFKKPIDLGKAPVWKEYGKEMAQEALEENVELIAQKQGEKFANEQMMNAIRGRNQSENYNTLNMDWDNPYYDASYGEIFETSLLGAAGGFMGQGLIQGVGQNLGSSESKGLLGRIPKGVGDKWVDFRSKLFGHKQADTYEDTQYYEDGTVKHRKGDVKYEMKERTHVEDRNYEPQTVLTEDNISEDAKAKGYKIGDVIKESDVIENKKGDIMTVTGKDGKKESLLDVKRDDKGNPIIKYKQDSKGKDRRFSTKELKDERTKAQETLLESHKKQLENGAKFMATVKYQNKLEEGIQGVDTLIDKGRTISTEDKKGVFNNLAYLDLVAEGNVEMDNDAIQKKSKELEEKYNKGEINEKDLRRMQEQMTDFSLARTALHAFETGNGDYLKDLYNDIANLSDEQAAEKGYSADYRQKLNDTKKKLERYEQHWTEYNAKHDPDIAKALYMNRVKYDQLSDDLNNLNTNTKQAEKDLLESFKSRTDKDLDAIDSEGRSGIDKLNEALRITREKNSKIKRDKTYNNLLEKQRELNTELVNHIRGIRTEDMDPAQVVKKTQELQDSIDANNKALVGRRDQLSKPFDERIDALNMPIGKSFSPLMNAHDSKLKLMDQAMRLDEMFDTLRSDAGRLELESRRAKKQHDRRLKQQFRSWMNQLMQIQKDGGGVTFDNQLGELVVHNGEYHFRAKETKPFTVDEESKNILLKNIKVGKKKAYENWLIKEKEKLKNEIENLSKAEFPADSKEKTANDVKIETRRQKLSDINEGSLLPPPRFREWIAVEGDKENEGLFIMIKNGDNTGESKLWYKPQGKEFFKELKNNITLKKGDEVFQGPKSDNLKSLGKLKEDKEKDNFTLQLNEPIDLMKRNIISFPVDVKNVNSIAGLLKDDFEKQNAIQDFKFMMVSRAARYNKLIDNNNSLYNQKLSELTELESQRNNIIKGLNDYQKALAQISNGDLLGLLNTDIDSAEMIELTRVLAKIKGYKDELVSESAKDIRKNLDAIQDEISEENILLDRTNDRISEIVTKLESNNVSKTERKFLQTQYKELSKRRDRIKLVRIPNLEFKLQENQRIIDTLAEALINNDLLDYTEDMNYLTGILDSYNNFIERSESNAETISLQVEWIDSILGRISKSRDKQERFTVKRDNVVDQIGDILVQRLRDELGEMDSAEFNEWVAEYLPQLDNLQEIVESGNLGELPFDSTKELETLVKRYKWYNDRIKKSQARFDDYLNSEEIKRLQQRQDFINQIAEIKQEISEVKSQRMQVEQKLGILQEVSNTALEYLSTFNQRLNTKYLVDKAEAQVEDLQKGDGSITTQVKESLSAVRDEIERVVDIYAARDENGTSKYELKLQSIADLENKLYTELMGLRQDREKLAQFKPVIESLDKTDMNSIEELTQSNIWLRDIENGQLEIDIESQIDLLSQEIKDLQLERKTLIETVNNPLAKKHSEYLNELMKKEVQRVKNEIAENTIYEESIPNIKNNLDEIKGKLDTERLNDIVEAKSKVFVDLEFADGTYRLRSFIEPVAFIEDVTLTKEELNEMGKVESEEVSGDRQKASMMRKELAERIIKRLGNESITGLTEEHINAKYAQKQAEVEANLNEGNFIQEINRDLENYIQDLEIKIMDNELKYIGQDIDAETDMLSRELEVLDKQDRIDELEVERKLLEERLETARRVVSEDEKTGFANILFKTQMAKLEESRMTNEFNDNNKAGDTRIIELDDKGISKIVKNDMWMKGKPTVFSTMNPVILQSKDGGNKRNSEGIPVFTANEHELRYDKFLNSIKTDFNTWKNDHQVQFVAISEGDQAIVENSVINDLPAWDDNKQSGTILSNDIKYKNSGLLAVITNKDGEWLHVNENGHVKYAKPHERLDGYNPVFSNITRYPKMGRNMMLRQLQRLGVMRTDQSWNDIKGKDVIINGKKIKVDESSEFQKVVKDTIKNTMDRFRTAARNGSVNKQPVVAPITDISDGHVISFAEPVSASEFINSNDFSKFRWTGFSKGQTARIKGYRNRIISGIVYIETKQGELIQTSMNKLSNNDIRLSLRLLQEMFPDRRSWVKTGTYKDQDGNEITDTPLANVYEKGKLLPNNVGLINKIFHWAGNKNDKNYPFSIWLEKGAIHYVPKGGKKKSISIDYINSIYDLDKLDIDTFMEQKKDDKSADKQLVDFINFLRTKNQHVEFKLLNTSDTYYHPKMVGKSIVLRRYNNYHDFLASTNRLRTKAIPESVRKANNIDSPVTGRYLEFSPDKSLYSEKKPVKPQQDEKPDNSTPELPNSQEKDRVETKPNAEMNLGMFSNGDTLGLYMENQNNGNSPAFEFKTVDGNTYARFILIGPRSEVNKDGDIVPGTQQMVKVASYYKVEDGKLIHDDEVSNKFKALFNSAEMSIKSPIEDSTVFNSLTAKVQENTEYYDSVFGDMFGADGFVQSNGTDMYSLLMQIRYADLMNDINKFEYKGLSGVKAAKKMWRENSDLTSEQFDKAAETNPMLAKQFKFNEWEAFTSMINSIVDPKMSITKNQNADAVVLPKGEIGHGAGIVSEYMNLNAEGWDYAIEMRHTSKVIDKLNTLGDLEQFPNVRNSKFFDLIKQVKNWNQVKLGFELNNMNEAQYNNSNNTIEMTLRTMDAFRKPEMVDRITGVMFHELLHHELNQYLFKADPNDPIIKDLFKARNGMIQYLINLAKNDVDKFNEIINDSSTIHNGKVISRFSYYATNDTKNWKDFLGIDEFKQLILTSDYYTDVIDNMKDPNDLTEFMANVMTTGSFQNVMNEIDIKELNKSLKPEDKIKGGNSLFKNFLKILKDALKTIGINIKSNSLLEESVRATSELMGSKNRIEELAKKDKEENEENPLPNQDDIQKLANKVRKNGGNENTRKESVEKSVDPRVKKFLDLKEKDSPFSSRRLLRRIKKLLRENIDMVEKRNNDEAFKTLVEVVDFLKDNGKSPSISASLDSDESSKTEIRKVLSSSNPAFRDIAKHLLNSKEYNTFFANMNKDPEFQDLKIYYDMNDPVSKRRLASNYLETTYSDYLETPNDIKPYLKEFFDKLSNELQNLNLNLRMNNKNNFNGIQVSQKELSSLYEGMTHYLFDAFRQYDIDAFFSNSLDPQEIYNQVKRNLTYDIGDYVSLLAEYLSNPTDFDIETLSDDDPTEEKAIDFIEEYDELSLKSNRTTVEENRLNELNSEFASLSKIYRHVVEDNEGFTKLVRQHSDYIRSYGMSFTEDQLDRLKFDNENEAVKDTLGARNETEFNQKDSLPPAIKLLIASLTNHTFDQLRSEKEGTNLYNVSTNYMNLPVPHDFDATYNFITKNVANLPADASVLAQAMEDLHNSELNKKGSVLHGLFSGMNPILKLKDRKGDDLSINDIRLLQQFAQSFSKYSPRFFTARVDNEGVVHYLDSNQHKTSRKITRGWAENYKAVLDELPDGSRQMNKAKALQVVKSLNALGSKIESEKDHNYYKALAKTLSELGIQFDRIKEVDVQLGKEGSSIIDKVGSKNSIKDQLLAMIEGTDDNQTHFEYNPIENRETLGTINYLADIEASLSNQVVDNQFISADNKTVYGITLNHLLSNAVSNINYYAKNGNLKVEMPHLFNAFNTNSVVLNGIVNNSLNVEVGLLNGMTSEGSQGKVLKDLNSADRWSMLLSSTLLRGMYSFYRAADRGTENFFKFTNKDGSDHLLYGHSIDKALNAHVGYLLDEVNAIMEFKRNGLGKDIAYYKDKGDKWRFFDSNQISESTKDTIMKMIDNKNNTYQTIKDYINTPEVTNSLKREIKSFYQKRASETKKVIKDLGLLAKVPTDVKSEMVWDKDKKGYVQKAKPNAYAMEFAGIPPDLLEPHLTSKKPTSLEYSAAIDKMLLKFELIQTGAYIEQNKMFVGDPAFFKNSDDFFKRMSMMNSTKKMSITDAYIDEVLDNNNTLTLTDGNKEVVLSKKDMKTLIRNDYNIDKLPKKSIKGLKKSNIEIVPGVGFNPSLILTDSIRTPDFKTAVIKDDDIASFLANDGDVRVKIVDGKLEYVDSKGVKADASLLRRTFAQEFYNDGITNESILNAKVNSYLDNYEKMEEADGQAYVTLPAYKEILIKSGDWTIKHNKAYDKLIQSKPLSNDELFLFRVLKTQYAGVMSLSDSSNGEYNNGDEVLDSNRNLFIPTGYKHSIFPLVPELIKGTSLEKLNKVMIENNVSMAQMASGNKFGRKLQNGKINKLYDDKGKFAINNSNIISQSTPWKYFGVQLDQAPKLKKKITASTQFRKLVLSNMIERGVPVDYANDQRKETPNITDDEIQERWNDISSNKTMAKLHSPMYAMVDEYTEIQKALFKKPFEKLSKELELEAILDDNGDIESYVINNRDSLIRIVEEMAKDRNMTENIIQSIQDLYNNDSYLEQVLNKDKVENVLYAIVNSRVIREKRKGEAAPQVAISGFELGNRTYDKGKIQSNDRLKSYTKADDGSTRPCEMIVGIPKDWMEWVDDKYGDLDGFNKYLDKLFDKIERIEMRENIEDLDLYYTEEEKNIIKLLTVVGFRIPNQGLNSSEIGRIRQFMPYTFGDSIIVPSEIVAKSGSDFDIDKMNLYYANYKKPKKLGNGKWMSPSYTKYDTEHNDQMYIDYVYNTVSRDDIELDRDDYISDESQFLETDLDVKVKSLNEIKENLKDNKSRTESLENQNLQLGKELFKAIPSRNMKEQYWNKEDELNSEGTAGLAKQLEYLQFTQDKIASLDPNQTYTKTYKNRDKQAKEKFNGKEVIDQLKKLEQYYKDQIAYFTGEEKFENSPFVGILIKLKKERKKLSEQRGDLDIKATKDALRAQRRADSKLFHKKVAQLLAERNDLMKEDEFRDTPIEELNSISKLQNRMIELHEDIMTQQYNYRQLMAPVSDAILNGTSIGAVWDVRMWNSGFNDSDLKSLIFERNALIEKYASDISNIKAVMVGKKIITDLSRIKTEDYGGVADVQIDNKSLSSSNGRVIFTKEAQQALDEEFKKIYITNKNEWSKKDNSRRKKAPLSNVASPKVNMEKFIYFLSGKAGVGQTAVHITHHQLGMAVDLFDKRQNNFWIFDHNKSNGKSSFAGKKDRSGEWLSETLSAFLNAYVDIAKDPYIFDLNAGNSTANTIFMLIRSGADVQWVSRFMNQPIIKEYVKAQSANESFFKKSLKMEGKKGDLISELMIKYGGDPEKKDYIYSINQELDNEAEGIFDSWNLTLDPIKKAAAEEKYSIHKGNYSTSNESTWTDYKRMMDLGLFDNNRLAEYMLFSDENVQKNNYLNGVEDKNEISDHIKTLGATGFMGTNEGKFHYNRAQRAMLDLFLEYQRQSKDFQMMIRATSPDTKGLGKDLSSNENTQEELTKVKFFDNYGNLDKMFENTIISQPNEVLKTSTSMYKSMYYSRKDAIVANTIANIRNDISGAMSMNADKKVKLSNEITNDFFSALITSGILDQGKDDPKSFKAETVFEQLFISSNKNKYVDKNGKPTSLPTIIQELKNPKIDLASLQARYANAEVKPSILVLANLKDNMFIQEARGVTPNKSYKNHDDFKYKTEIGYEPDFSTIRINNRIMTSALSNKLTDSLAVIRESNSEFYNDLLRFSILQSGFNNSNLSFTKYFPQDDINNLIKDSISEFSKLSDTTKEEIGANFANQYKRHTVSFNPGVDRLGRWSKEKKKNKETGKKEETGMYVKSFSSSLDTKISQLPFLFKTIRDKKTKKLKRIAVGGTIFTFPDGGKRKYYKSKRGGWVPSNFSIVGHGRFFKGYDIMNNVTPVLRSEVDEKRVKPTPTVNVKKKGADKKVVSSSTGLPTKMPKTITRDELDSSWDSVFSSIRSSFIGNYDIENLTTALPVGPIRGGDIDTANKVTEIIGIPKVLPNNVNDENLLESLEMLANNNWHGATSLADNIRKQIYNQAIGMIKPMLEDRSELLEIIGKPFAFELTTDGILYKFSTPKFNNGELELKYSIVKNQLQPFKGNDDLSKLLNKNEEDVFWNLDSLIEQMVNETQEVLSSVDNDENPLSKMLKDIQKERENYCNSQQEIPF